MRGAGAAMGGAICGGGATIRGGGAAVTARGGGAAGLGVCTCAAPLVASANETPARIDATDPLIRTMSPPSVARPRSQRKTGVRRYHELET